jgi:hypothetical protein
MEEERFSRVRMKYYCFESAIDGMCGLSVLQQNCDVGVSAATKERSFSRASVIPE